MGNAWEIPVSDCSRDTRDSMYTDPSYNSQLKMAITDMFAEFIRVENVIHVFQQYNYGVLTEEDKEKITITDGDRERSRELLNRLAMYENWFTCLLDVLENEKVKLTHVASAFRNKRDDLNEQWLQEPEMEDRVPSSLINENQRLKIKLEKEERSLTEEKMLHKKCEEQLNNLKTDQATINKIRMEENHNLQTKLKLLKQDYEHEKTLHMETQAKMIAGVSQNDVSESLEELRQKLEKLSKDYDKERESREDLESKIEVAEAEKLEMKQALVQEHQKKLDALKKDEENALKGLKDEIRLLTSQLENVRKECDLKRKSSDDFEAKTKIIEAEKSEIKQALEKEYQEKIEILKKGNEKEKTAHEQLKMKLVEIEAEQLEMRQSLEKKHQVILEALQNDAINKEHEEDKKAHEKLEALECDHGKRGKTQGLESFKSNDDSESSNKFQKISFTAIPMHGVIKIKENINVLLIGNTGSGKSATGNSILRRQVFKSVLSSMPVTTNISSETYTFDDRVITVFDGPGFEDPSEEAPVSEDYFIKAMKQAHAVNASGYHAFIIVFSAMRKADASDMNLIRLVKKYFGEDFLSKFCVIVMTGGDLLNDTMFSQWCSENVGSHEIILECGTAVLFDNKTKEQSRLEQQFKCLISLIDNLNQSDEELITFPDSITQA